MTFLRCLALLFALHAFLMPVAAQEAPASLDELAKAVKARTEKSCQFFQQKLARDEVNAANKAFLMQNMEMACTCLPAELDLVVEKIKSAAIEPTKQADPRRAFMTAFQGAVNTCGARSIRQSLAKCEQMPEPAMSGEQHTAYCDCMQSGLSKITDEQLINDAQTAHQRMLEKVRAEMNDKPVPQFEPTALQALEGACRPQ